MTSRRCDHFDEKYFQIKKAQVKVLFQNPGFDDTFRLHSRFFEIRQYPIWWVLWAMIRDGHAVKFQPLTAFYWPNRSGYLPLAVNWPQKCGCTYFTVTFLTTAVKLWKLISSKKHKISYWVRLLCFVYEYALIEAICWNKKRIN